MAMVVMTREPMSYREDYTSDSPNVTSDGSINLNAELHMQIMYGLIGVIGISGNTLVAGILLHFEATRKSLTNTFIINQSLIDATSSLFIILSTFIRDVDISSMLGQELFCRLWLTNLPMWSMFVSSTYNMVAVTLERYYAVVHPLSHHQYFTRSKALLTISGVWLLGPAFNAAYMIPTAGMQNGKCTVYSIWMSEQLHTIFGIITVLLQYFIPLGLVIYAYSRIAVVLKKAGGQEKDVNSATRDVRIARARQNVIKTLALVSVCFGLCWSWNQIYFTMYNVGYNADFNGTFYHFTVIMVFCNSCINPFVYAAKFEQFKRAARTVFCKRGTDNNDDLMSTNAVPTAADDQDGSRVPAEEAQKLSRIQRNARLLQRMSSDPMLTVNTDIAVISGTHSFSICTQL